MGSTKRVAPRHVWLAHAAPGGAPSTPHFDLPLLIFRRPWILVGASKVARNMTIPGGNRSDRHALPTVVVVVAAVLFSRFCARVATTFSCSLCLRVRTNSSARSFLRTARAPDYNRSIDASSSAAESAHF